LSSEESALGNLHAPFGVECSEIMEGCLGTYVFIMATLSSVSERHG